MMTPGTYRLRADTANPKPDRRARQDALTSWHQWAVWPAGTIFIVEQNPEFLTDRLPPYLAAYGIESPVRLRTYARHGYQSHAITSHLPWHEEAWNALTAAMEPMQESPSDFLIRVQGSCAGRYALDILDRCLSITDIARVMAEMDAEDVDR